MNGDFRTIISGLATVVAIAVIFGYATWGKSFAELDGYTLKAEFGRINGVGVGSPVQLAGIQVGAVTSARLIQESKRAEIAMTIQDGIEVPTDSVALIVSDSLFSDKFIRIDPGGMLDVLGDGDRFEYVQDSIDLIGLFQKIVESAERNRGIVPE